LPVFQPASLRSPAAVETVRDARPRALVVAAYGMILPQDFLDAAPLGAFNIHASLLPRWRGAAPIQRAILAGDSETGVSIMRMDAGLDTGPVLAQRAIGIAIEDDGGTVHDRLAALGAQMMLQVLDDVEAGRVQARAQPSEGVTYAAKITKKDSTLDWSRSAAELERAVRAFRPTPGAGALLDGEPIKVWRALARPGTGTPGALVASNGTIEVACGAGLLEIQELQRAGGRRMNTAEFLRGNKLGPATRFQ
jgi:methionyl-tRNA formyltransferase